LYNTSVTDYNYLLFQFRVGMRSEVSLEEQSLGISPAVIRLGPGEGIKECWLGQIRKGGGPGVQ
jgi:hypothetical protein